MMKFVMSLPIDDRNKVCVMYVYACVSETAYLWQLRFCAVPFSFSLSSRMAFLFHADKVYKDVDTRCSAY